MTFYGLLQALEKYNVEKDIAAFIKKEFDKKYNPTWHAIVGRNFGETLQAWFLGLTLTSCSECKHTCRLIRNTRDQALHLFLPG